MFVICRNGHLGFFWKGEQKLFIEKESCIISSRKECLHYLMKCGLNKEDAVFAIALMQKTGNWISF